MHIPVGGVLENLQPPFAHQGGSANHEHPRHTELPRAVAGWSPDSAEMGSPSVGLQAHS